MGNGRVNSAQGPAVGDDVLRDHGAFNPFVCVVRIGPPSRQLSNRLCYDADNSVEDALPSDGLETLGFAAKSTRRPARQDRASGHRYRLILAEILGVQVGILLNAELVEPDARGQARGHLLKEKYSERLGCWDGIPVRKLFFGFIDVLMVETIRNFLV